MEGLCRQGRGFVDVALPFQTSKPTPKICRRTMSLPPTYVSSKCSAFNGEFQ